MLSDEEMKMKRKIANMQMDFDLGLNLSRAFYFLPVTRAVLNPNAASKAVPPNFENYLCICPA